ncbi:MAG: D-inositol-3-phosphate glycosyltransferase [Actinomycetota bacterium]
MKTTGRIAQLMMHTSPLEQTGARDAGGMNVYVVETAKRLAKSGIAVDIFTRATSGALPPVVEIAPGVEVHHITAGPYEGLTKEDLPSQMCTMASELLRVEANHPRGYYDLIHSHYWISGQVGLLASQRWDVPLVHTMHTMAKVKNLALADHDQPEPVARAIGEEQIVAGAKALIANTDAEAANLVSLYNACPDRVHVVSPGVDLEHFAPGGGRREARVQLGLDKDSLILAFVGRIQPHKGPDVLISAAAEMIKHDPVIKSRLQILIIGGVSGGNGDELHRLQSLARFLGVHDRVKFIPPVSRAELPHWYRAADLVCVPSYSESFGLVALEAQACGTPVVAAAVGGLRTAVADGFSGSLVDGHDARSWSAVLTRLLQEPQRRIALSMGALEHARRFGWEATARGTIDIYDRLLAEPSAVVRSLA